MTAPALGTLVGARRWPDSHAHPDCWGRPWPGVVVPLDDPRAWQGTLAFPRDELPDAGAVSAHVAACLLRGWLRDRVAVLWDFGSHGSRCYFESDLRPYAEDLAAWETARAEAYGRCPLRATS